MNPQNQAPAPQPEQVSQTSATLDPPVDSAAVTQQAVNTGITPTDSQPLPTVAPSVTAEAPNPGEVVEASSSAPRLQSEVRLYTGLTVFQNKKVLLSWDDDGHIRARETASSQPIIDFTPQQIKSAAAQLSQLVLKVDGKTYRFDFAAGATTTGLVISGLGGVVGAAGLAIAAATAKNSGAGEWITSLESQGVEITSADSLSGLKFGLKAGLILGVIIFIAPVILFIVLLLSGSL
jgi:hypothetical protein